MPVFTGFSRARIWSLRVEPFSVITWVISVRSFRADVPPAVVLEPRSPDRASHGGVDGLQRR
eukprot:5914168-Prymnesium_polylepis.1